MPRPPPPATAHTRHVARRLAVVTDALIVSVDYRLAPEHPFPQPHDDCWAVTQWLSAQAASIGGDPSRIIIFGDSAAEGAGEVSGGSEERAEESSERSEGKAGEGR